MRGTFFLAIGAVFGGCTCVSSDAPSPQPPFQAATRTTGPTLATKDFYRLDRVDGAACKTNATFDIKIALTALAGHHINREFPTKFVAAPIGDLAVEDTAFSVETETRGVMSIRVNPASAGTHVLSGKFKLGVCTDRVCDVDSPTIEIPIECS